MQLSHFLILATAGARAVQARRLNVTAVGAANMASVVECWQTEAQFEWLGTPGSLGVSSVSLGDAANASLHVVAPGYDTGLHNPQVNQ